MAAPTPPPRPGRPLAFVAVLIVVMYAGMMLIQSTWKPTPQLGLDLRGGTSVTLTAQAAEGSGSVSRSAMNQAKDIITNRVNGTGVAEAEVAVQGNNIIVNVPGEQFDADLLSTALLRFRQVLQVAPVTPAAQPSPSPSGEPSPTASPSESASPSDSASPTESGRALSESLLGAQDSTPTDPSSPATTSPSPSPTPTGEPAEEQVPVSPEVPAEVQQRFDELTDCASIAEQRGGEIEPAEELLVTCSEDGAAKYILGPVAVDGTNVSSVQAALPAASVQWQVDLSFDGTGTDDFAYITEQVFALAPPMNQLAIVLDGLVVSAPVIQESLPTGQATITGDFTQDEAEDLADVLKYGALPLAFEQQELNEISATLGSDYLQVGLAAGIIGLILVVGYLILYYRGLAVVAVSSLAVAAVLVYAAVVLLGEWIDFTLTLAGIAGLIVAIGITADSFVVFFERLRDEVREGRSLRAAVEHGWNRAKRTILVADTVSFLAAAVLYLLAIGNVRGFAFTLGLTTVIDVLVVFLFTKPLMTVLARTKFFGGGHRWSGLDPARLGAREVAPVGQPQTIVARRRAAGAEET